MVSIEADILKSSRVVAVVGLSSNPERPSYQVASYLKEQGYRIIPVNPKENRVLGEVTYPDLYSVPEPMDVVDVFRRPEEVPSIVEQAIKIGAKAVWMQEGIVNEAAAAQAREAGLLVVMDKCMLKEHQKLGTRSKNDTVEEFKRDEVPLSNSTPLPLTKGKGKKGIGFTGTGHIPG